MTNRFFIRIFWLVLSFTCLAFSSAHAQIVITDFGLGQLNNILNGPDKLFTSINQGQTTCEFIGDDSSTMIGNISPAPIDISSISNAVLVLFGTYSGSATSPFQIELVDSGGNLRTFEGNWSAFTPSVLSSIQMTFQSDQGIFDPTSVMAISLIGGGAGFGTVDFIADQLIIVPEPTIFGLLGITMVVGLFWCRRKRIS